MFARNGAFRLFTFQGIGVHVHWSWFVAAMLLIQNPVGHYSGDAYLWFVLEYLALFGIVLLHELGHALACKQVGGEAHEIVLWPLGGVAFVSPPQRPGATLWSIAAGPLVNVALIPVLETINWAIHAFGWLPGVNAHIMLHAITYINYGILIFNLIPVYPLDGGQILRSLLWFVIGRGRSLLAASVIGFAGVAVLLVLAVLGRNLWLGLISGFVLLNCWQGLRQAMAMSRIDDLPHRKGFACPGCQTPPHIGNYWMCSQCRTPFDTFASRAQCPNCNTTFTTTRCMTCGSSHPLSEWHTSRPPPPPPFR
jgi:Zn-dependent protease